MGAEITFRPTGLSASPSLKRSLSGFRYRRKRLYPEFGSPFFGIVAVTFVEAVLVLLCVDE